MKPGAYFTVALVVAGLILGLLIAGAPPAASIGVLAGIAVLYLSLFRPILVIAALLCVVPFNVLWLGVGVTWPELAYSVAFIIVAACWAARRFASAIFGQRTKSLASPLAPALSVFLLTAAVACVVGIFRGNEPAHWGSDVNALGFYGLCFIIPDIAGDRGRLRKLFFVVVIATVLGMVKSLIEGFLNPYPELDLLGRLLPGFGGGSEAGFAMLLLCVAFAVTLKPGRKRNFFTAVSFFLAAMQALSLVRSRWIAALAGGVFIFLVSYEKEKRGVLRFAGTGFLLILLYFSAGASFPAGSALFGPVHAIEKRYESIFTSRSEPSIVTRGSEWGEAQRKALRHPFFGNGLGTTITYYRYDLWFGTPAWETTRFIHNVYLSLFLNLGAMGLMAFIWLIVSVIRYALRLYGRLQDEEDKAVALGVATAFFSLAVASLAGPLLTSPMLTMWLGFFIGALVVIEGPDANIR